MLEVGETGRSTAGRLLAPLLVAVVAIVVYANTLSLGFTWDDDWLIVNNRPLAEPGYVRQLLLDGRLWRPVKRLTLLLDYRLWGLSRPAGFHATNVALHAAASVGLFAVALRLGLARRTALLAAVAFAVHPIHVEAVACISHRKESLALLFLLLGMLAYLRMRAIEPLVRWAALQRAGLVGATAAGYLLGMLSKEVGAVMMPATLVAYELGRRRRGVGTARRQSGWTIAVAAGFALVLVLFTVRGYLGSIPRRFTAENIQSVTSGEVTTYAEMLRCAVAAFGGYARLLIWPWPLYLDRDFPIPTGLADPRVLVGLAALALYVVGLVVAWRRSPIAGFGLAWYGLHLLPVLNVVPLTYWLIAERFAYVPSAGLAVAFAVVVERLAARLATMPVLAWALNAVVVVMLGAHAGLTVVQNRVWTNTASLWSNTLRHHPESARGLQAIAYERHLALDYDAAEESYRRAISGTPAYAPAHLGLAALLADAGRLAEAIEVAWTYVALKERPDPASYLVIAKAERKRGRYVAAAEAYLLAIERDPRNWPYLESLAQLAALTADPDQAARVLELAFSAGESSILWTLRGEQLQASGRGDEAEACFARARELDASKGPRKNNFPESAPRLAPDLGSGRPRTRQE